MRACAPWLREELRTLQPDVLVLMGATAAQSLLGGTFRITQAHGKPIASELTPLVFASIHPSAVLRAPDHEAREASFAELVRDLGLARDALRG